MRGYRNVRHAQQDTTGACEGCHSSIKGGGLAQKRHLIGRRTDWLLHKLFVEVSLVTDCARNAGHFYLLPQHTPSAYTFHLWQLCCNRAKHDTQCLTSFLALPGIDAQLVLLLFDLRVEVATMYTKEGFVHNSKQEQLVATAVVASQQILMSHQHLESAVRL